MAVKLHHDIPEQAPDIGQHGYQTLMHVYLNQAPDAEALAEAGVTRAYARTVIDNGLHRVGFSSLPGGLGVFGVMELSEEDASHYPLGTQVTFHFKKTKELGFGELVAVTPLMVEPIAGVEESPSESPRM